MAKNELLMAISNEVLNIADNKDEFTRGDFQGAIEAQISSALDCGRKLEQAENKLFARLIGIVKETAEQGIIQGDTATGLTEFIIGDDALHCELEDIFTALLKMEKREISTEAEARGYAMDWQAWASNQNLSYGELAEWQAIFIALAEKYGLTDEFKENGII